MKPRRARSFAYPEESPFPDRQMRMVDRIEHFDPAGGPKGLGFIRGTTSVNADAWFFGRTFLRIQLGRGRWGWSRLCS